MKPNFSTGMSTNEADGLVLALELVATTMLLAGLGFLIDRALGITPVLTVALGGFTFGYEVWKIVRGYNTEMDRHVAERAPLHQGPR